MEAKATGRDELGRFIPGHRGGPGRRSRPVEERYLKALQSVCTLKAWRAIVLRAIEQAKEGDAASRSWLSRYLIGDTQTVLVDDQARAVDHAAELQKAVEAMHDDGEYIDFLRFKAMREDAGKPHVPDNGRFQNVSDDDEDDD